MKNEAWGGRWQAAAPQASGAECSLRAASRLWSPSLAKSVNDPGCHLINTNKQQMSHIIVSPGGRCQAVTWKKKKKCLCECERVCVFISFIFHGPFFSATHGGWIAQREIIKRRFCLQSIIYSAKRLVHYWLPNIFLCNIFFLSSIRVYLAFKTTLLLNFGSFVNKQKVRINNKPVQFSKVQLT